MKRLISTALFLSIAGAQYAQIITTGRIELGYPDRSAMSIPKEFSCNNVPYLTMYDNTDNRNLLIYNDDLELVKTINIQQEHTFDYQLTYQDEEREISAVTIAEENEQEYGMSYEMWLQQQKNMDPTFTESELTITKEANGDSLIIVQYSENGYYPVEQLYFNYSYFGKKYPKRYWRCKNGQMYLCDVRYEISYTDWHVTGTRTENLQENLRRLYLCNINLNYGVGRTNYYFEASQTLFNEDDKFEYIIPKYVLSETGSSSYYDVVNPGGVYGDEPVEVKRSRVISEKDKLALVGFQVVSEDGSIIKDITFDNGFQANSAPYYVFIITIGDKTYMAFEGYENEASCTLFYKIDRETSSISKVKTAPVQMSVSPTIAERGTPINVTFSDGNSEGSTIDIYSNNGIRIGTSSVPAGQSRTQIRVDGAAGMYHVIRSSAKGKDNKKIIVK